MDALSLMVNSTLAHEFQHMLLFANKDHPAGLHSDTWYNEMLSMLAELTRTVKELLSQQTATSRSQAGLGSQRQKICVDEALASVEHALAVDDYGLGLDAAVQDIEDALAALGEITGAVSPDDILGNIFSRFCVGK